MNKDSVKAFVDWATRPDTVAVMVISKKDGEFRSALMDGSGKYSLDREFMEGDAFDYLQEHKWNGDRLQVPDGMSWLELQVWLATHPETQEK